MVITHVVPATLIKSSSLKLPLRYNEKLIEDVSIARIILKIHNNKCGKILRRYPVHLNSEKVMFGSFKLFDIIIINLCICLHYFVCAT